GLRRTAHRRHRALAGRDRQDLRRARLRTDASSRRRDGRDRDVVRAATAPLAKVDYARAMADDALPKPEPKEIDEKLALQLKHLAEDAVLKGQPYGDEQCSNCLYY